MGGNIHVRIDAHLATIVPGYLSNRLNDLLAIRNALGANDYDRIRTIGVSMKGSGGSYGFDAISEYGHDLEIGAQHRDRDLIMGTLDNLQCYLECVEIRYENTG